MSEDKFCYDWKTESFVKIIEPTDAQRLKVAQKKIAQLTTRIMNMRKALCCIRSAKAGAALNADNTAIQNDDKAP